MNEEEARIKKDAKQNNWYDANQDAPYTASINRICIAS